MRTVSKSMERPKALDDGELASAAEVMAAGILASDSKSRRQMQNRLYALRAMERLGLLGDAELKRALSEEASPKVASGRRGSPVGYPRRVGANQGLGKIRRRGVVGT
jgi:hypothetical protein